MTIDRAAHRVTVDGHEVELTPTEYRLLVTLADRRGRVQGRAHLLETVWEAAPDIQTRTVDMHVQRLRAKLGAAGDMIETVRGFGYRLNAGQPRSVRASRSGCSSARSRSSSCSSLASRRLPGGDSSGG